MSDDEEYMESLCLFENPRLYRQELREKERHGKVIKKPYPRTTVRQRIAEAYNEYIREVESKYKLNAWLKLSHSFVLDDELSWAIPYTELKKNLMINYPIGTDVKVHVLWHEDDWVSDHSVWDEYLDPDCDTYILKHVKDWRDLLVRVIQHYKKNRYIHTYRDKYLDKLKLCDIEKLQPEHLKAGFKKNIKQNDYLIRIITTE